MALKRLKFLIGIIMMVGIFNLPYSIAYPLRAVVLGSFFYFVWIAYKSKKELEVILAGTISLMLLVFSFSNRWFVLYNIGTFILGIGLIVSIFLDKEGWE